MAKEYIERDAAINRLQTVSMPDDPYSKGIQRGVEHAIDVIKEAPAADVVEVVHCGECKSWCSIGNGKAGTCKGKVQGVTKPDDFCSRGERRGNDA